MGVSISDLGAMTLRSAKLALGNPTFRFMPGQPSLSLLKDRVSELTRVADGDGMIVTNLGRYCISNSTIKR